MGWHGNDLHDLQLCHFRRKALLLKWHNCRSCTEIHLNTLINVSIDGAGWGGGADASVRKSVCLSVWRRSVQAIVGPPNLDDSRARTSVLAVNAVQDV